MEHKDIPSQEVHTPYSWIVADATERALLEVGANDIGKLCWQVDDNSEWVMTGIDPVKWLTRDGGELFEISYHNGPIESIRRGKIPAIGQVWYADTYPDAAERLEAGDQFMVPEELWNTGVAGNPDAFKGCWSSGGTDERGRWYRAPKLNGDTNYRAPFLRGSMMGFDAGMITDDRIRNFVGEVSGMFGQAAGTMSGVLKKTAKGGNSGINSGSDTGYQTISIDLTGSVPTGPENSPRYHGVITCICMFGSLKNVGSVDVLQLATEQTVINTKVSDLEVQVNKLKANDYYPEAVWEGNVGTLTDLTLSREILEGEIIVLKHSTAGAVLSSPQVYFPSVAHQVSGGTYMTFMAGTVTTTLSLIKPTAPGKPSVIKMLIYTGGYGVAGFYVLKKKD